MNAAAPDASGRGLLSIGEVLTALRPEFPEVTISKIRFLETEGLVEPTRTPSGYRKFNADDIDRLRYVLTMQRDRYLPLKVIREHLDAIDRGLEPPTADDAGPRAPRTPEAADGLPTGADFVRGPAELRLSREELQAESGLADDTLAQLEAYGLITSTGRHFDGDALLVARTVAEMAEYGLEARHLRSFRVAADREVGLIEQVVSPLARRRGPEVAARAEETVRELAALSVRLHAALVRRALHRDLLG
jgi:DNA-binding transcriptional MerR regulator